MPGLIDCHANAGHKLVKRLAGGDSVMRTDSPALDDGRFQGVAETGIRDIMAVGPTRPPHPRPYADWAGGIQTGHTVSFEQIAGSATSTPPMSWRRRRRSVRAGANRLRRPG